MDSKGKATGFLIGTGRRGQGKKGDRGKRAD